jgi:hypothetical protein
VIVASHDATNVQTPRRSGGAPRSRRNGPTLTERLELLGYQTLRSAPDELLLTDAETAALLSVSPRLTESWRATGRGPRATRISARRIGYRLGDVRAYIGGAR